MSNRYNFRRSLLVASLSLVLLPQQAAATSDGAAVGVGLAALLGGLLIGSMSSDSHKSPPTVPVQAVHVYTLRERAEMGEVSSQLKLAENYEESHNDAEAFKWYAKAAYKGNNVAQLKVGLMLSEGKGVQRNNLEAIDWYFKSAAQGNNVALEELIQLARQGSTYAQVRLGYIYQNGRGVPQSGLIAANWYRMAAEQGDADAQNGLGTIYENGDDVVRDYTAAFRWYKYGARQGNQFAQANLGRVYMIGRGVSRNPVEAYKWLSLAAAKKNKIAEDQLQTFETTLSLNQIEEGQALARAFIAQPPYTKDEMDFYNKVDDVKNFIVEYSTPITAVVIAIAALFIRRYNLKRSQPGSGHKLNALDKIMQRFALLGQRISLRTKKAWEPFAGKNLFQIIEIQFTGPNRFHSFFGLALCLFLLISNPTERDFDTYFRHRIEKYGDGNKFTEGVASTIVNNIVERHSYGLFSLFGFNASLLVSLNKDIENKKYLGIGGTIIPLTDE